MSFELYRHTRLGDCLQEALEDLGQAGKINEDLQNVVLKQFDISIMEALEKHVTAKAQIKANVSSYKYYDNVWQFTLKSDIHFKLNATGTGSMNSAPEVPCDQAKVVIVDAKVIGQ